MGSSATIQSSPRSDWVLAVGAGLYALGFAIFATGSYSPRLAPVGGLLGIDSVAQLGTVVWFYVENLTPYFFLVFYRDIRGSALFRSLPFVVGLILAVNAVFLRMSWYYHLPMDAGDFVFGIWLLERWRFARPDAFILSGLAVIGADAYFQIPAYVVWTLQGHGLASLAGILLSAGWGWMSVPVFLHLAAKFSGTTRIMVGPTSKKLVLVMLAATAAAFPAYLAGHDIYFTFPAWFGLLLSVARDVRGSVR